jgi:hypothetical protein
MAEEKTGAVRFRGDPNTICFEAQDYHEDGSTRLQPGDELTGIPEEMLARFLLNGKFEAVGGAAQEVYEQTVNAPAARINGALVRELKADEVEAREAEAAEASVPLAQQNKTQLLATAQRVGVDANKNMTNNDIIKAIEGSANDPLRATTESTTTPPPAAETQGSEGGDS